MQAWLLRPVCASTRLSARRRTFNTLVQSHERVKVRCASAGSISVDLYNVNEQTASSALFIHFPPFPLPDASPAALPAFLEGQPVASINYRWGNHANDSNPDQTTQYWPTPLSDCLFAYSWLVKTLAPEDYHRRPIYVYGSYLGASLATSVSLTESHPHMKFAIRGFVSYNGIYNWTMFLPDHPINSRVKKGRPAANMLPPPRPIQGSYLDRLDRQLQGLFKVPTDMFDSFASPSLFFHNPGLDIPQSFTISASEAEAIEPLTNSNVSPLNIPQPPRNSPVIFPPWDSTLKIPEALLLHNAPVATPGNPTHRVRWHNTLENQARELAQQMRRSINRMELVERTKWDDEMDRWKTEAQRRVQRIEVGEETQSLDLPREAEDMVVDWLEERIRIE